jgi:hypothetical protein
MAKAITQGNAVGPVAGSCILQKIIQEGTAFLPFDTRFSFLPHWTQRGRAATKSGGAELRAALEVRADKLRYPPTAYFVRVGGPVYEQLHKPVSPGFRDLLAAFPWNSVLNLGFAD